MDGTGVLFLADDSLSKYNVAAYPVTIPSSNLAQYYWNLADTYWSVTDTSRPHADWTYVYRITRPTNNPTIQQYGGYLFEQWSEADKEFQHVGSFYIYSNVNMTHPAARDDLTGLTYNNGTPVDLENNPNHFIFDYGNGKRTLGIIDVSNPSKMTLIPTDQYTANDHSPLGGMNVFLNEMDIITTTGNTSLSPTLFEESGGQETINNKIPSEAGRETVCAFMLYRDSCTDGNISTDFALPSISHTQMIVSPSFMDNPAVWLTTAGRFDEVKYINDDNDVMTEEKCIQHVVVGNQNPTLSYDNSLSRCAFSNLHIAKRLGADDMPTDDNGDLVQTTMGSLAVKIADTNIKHGFYWNLCRAFGQDSGFFEADYQDTNSGLNYSVSGISIDSMYGESSTQNSQSLSMIWFC